VPHSSPIYERAFSNANTSLTKWKGCSTLARPQGDVPAHLAVAILFPLLDTLVTPSPKAIALRRATAHGPGYVADIGGSSDNRGGQPRFGVNADVRLHADVLTAQIPLVALFGLVHLGVALATLVLCRGRRIAAGDPLERLDVVIDWEIFRPILERIDLKERKSAAGRKPTCRILMFKLLILQRLHNLADERLQYQVTDRLSFMRLLGIELSGDVPDARTVWAFREALQEHRLIEPLFERLNQALADLGVELKSGQIIDAIFVPVPIQRNGREDNIDRDTKLIAAHTCTPRMCMTARCSTPCYGMQRWVAKRCGQIAPIARTNRSKALLGANTKAGYTSGITATRR